MKWISLLCTSVLGTALMVPVLACKPEKRAAPGDHFLDLLRSPDAVTVVTDKGPVELGRAGGTWKSDGIEVAAVTQDGRLKLELAAPGAAVKTIVARWDAEPPAGWKYLGDAWERSYGELEWQPLDAAREMPWYFLASDGRTTHGYGVMTQPAAMCAWRAGAGGVTLAADVRCGGAGVRLGARRLLVCSVMSRRGKPGETPFEAARAFCRDMCPTPRLPKEPVYGFNDWYCDYGKNSAESVLYYAAFIARLAPKGDNRPFMVVDDGWQATGGGTGHGGPWDRGNASFPSMSDLADGIREAGARPGIWIHLLTAQEGQPDPWRLAHDPKILDISVPEVRAYVKETVARLRAWGYELIKHDYSVSDLAGYTRAAPPPEAAWTYADTGRTAAEIVLEHYRDIREAAGDGGLIIGCNTIGHLAAGPLRAPADRRRHQRPGLEPGPQPRRQHPRLSGAPARRLLRGRRRLRRPDRGRGHPLGLQQPVARPPGPLRDTALHLVQKGRAHGGTGEGRGRGAGDGRPSSASGRAARLVRGGEPHARPRGHLPSRGRRRAPAVEAHGQGHRVRLGLPPGSLAPGAPGSLYSRMSLRPKEAV